MYELLSQSPVHEAGNHVPSCGQASIRFQCRDRSIFSQLPKTRGPHLSNVDSIIPARLPGVNKTPVTSSSMRRFGAEFLRPLRSSGQDSISIRRLSSSSQIRSAIDADCWPGSLYWRFLVRRLAPLRQNGNMDWPGQVFTGKDWVFTAKDWLKALPNRHNTNVLPGYHSSNSSAITNKFKPCNCSNFGHAEALCAIQKFIPLLSFKLFIFFNIRDATLDTI
jgi:hypothetical protein